MSPVPGPTRTVPVSEIRQDPLGFLTRMRDEHGDVCRHRTEDAEVTLVNRPDLARVVLRERRHELSKLGTPDDAMLTPLLGRGLLTSEGEQWRRQRRLAQPAFEPRRVAQLDGLMTRAALELLERWQPAIADGRAVRVDHELTAFTLTVVARAVLGTDVGTGGRFGEAIDTINRFIGHEEPGAVGPEGDAWRAAFTQAVRFLDGLVRVLVDGRRVSGVRAPDLLDRLLHLEEGETPMTPRELRDQVLTMLMAGHETTAKSLTWTFWLLATHPEVDARLRAELDAVLGGRVPEVADLERLPWCRQVIQEAVRLFPPVWLVTRRATATFPLGDHEVAEGSLVCISPYLLHRHPEHWPDPDRFDPERFAPAAVAARHPFAYLPFSEGPRQCIGREFALQEAQLALATLWPRVVPRLVEGHPVEPEALVTLRPRNGLLMTLHAA